MEKCDTCARERKRGPEKGGCWRKIGNGVKIISIIVMSHTLFKNKSFITTRVCSLFSCRMCLSIIFASQNIEVSKEQ